MNSAYNTTGPRCPNHHVVLIDCSQGKGQCPESGVYFDYDEDTQEIKKKKVMRIINGEYQVVEVPQEEISSEK